MTHDGNTQVSGVEVSRMGHHKHAQEHYCDGCGRKDLHHVSLQARWADGKDVECDQGSMKLCDPCLRDLHDQLREARFGDRVGWP